MNESKTSLDDLILKVVFFRQSCGMAYFFLLLSIYLSLKYADCLVDFGFYLLNIDSIAPSMQVIFKSIIFCGHSLMAGGCFKKNHFTF